MIEHPVLSPIQTGLACRCPRCGRGALLRGALGIHDACPVCGLDYRFIDSGDGPAIFAIFILGFGVLGAAMVAHFKYELPLTVVYPVMFVVTPLVAIWLLRVLKATLIALQYRNKAEEGRLATRPPDGP